MGFRGYFIVIQRAAGVANDYAPSRKIAHNLHTSSLFFHLTGDRERFTDDKTATALRHDAHTTRLCIWSYEYAEPWGKSHVSQRCYLLTNY